MQNFSSTGKPIKLWLKHLSEPYYNLDLHTYLQSLKKKNKKINASKENNLFHPANPKWCHLEMVETTFHAIHDLQETTIVHAF